jgi:diguanylate cyclase (GGDEF)-like protein
VRGTALDTARSIVSSLPDAAVLLDTELKLVVYNLRYQELSGVRRRAIDTHARSGESPFGLIASVKGYDRDNAMACMAGKRPIHLAEMALRTASGAELTAYISFIPVLAPAGKPIGVIQVLRDVSDEARVQARYRELLDMARLRAENLEREVERRTQELSAALEEVTRLSRQDPLTGLLNRRSFTEMAERILRLAGRHGRTVGLLLVDLDHFKRINDTSGHQVGDAVLVAATTALTGSVRGTDLVGRFGGEEFVILLSETEPETVAATADRCRLAVSGAPPATDRQKMPTASIGAALFPQHGRTLDELVSSADAALYQAKHAGRDQVVLFEPSLQASAGAPPIQSRPRMLLVGSPALAIDTSAIAAEFDLTIIGDLAEAAALCQDSAFDVVMADCDDPDAGVELLSGVLRVRPDSLRVLVLDSEDEYAEVRGTMLARVDCFLLRSEGPQQVMEGVRHALSRREADRQRLLMTSDAVQRLFSPRLLELDRLIADDELRFAYQPIVCVRTGQVRAYEALCRADHPVFQDATVLFEAALQSGNLWRLGRMCRRNAVKRLADLDPGQLLFINLHPAELDDPELLSGELDRAAAERIVFEITERASIPDFKRFRTSTAALTSAGYRLAIDDLGAGYASLSAVALIEPRFVKLDMSMVRGIDRSRHKNHLVRRMVEFANDVGIEIIAEGVETAEEARVVGELGCHLAQGYFFGPPR